MVALRNWPKGAEYASFGLASLVFVLIPSELGIQNVAARVARQPAGAHSQTRLPPSRFGAMHTAKLDLPRPIGTEIPEPPVVRLASFEPPDDIVGSIGAATPGKESRGPVRVSPTINRTSKGDRLVPEVVPTEQTAPADEPVSATEPAVAPATSELAAEEFPEVQADILAAIERDKIKVGKPSVRPDEIEAAMRFRPFPEYDISMSLEAHPQIRVEEPVVVAKLDPADLIPNAPPSLDGLNAAVKAERLYFGNDPFSTSLSAIEPWALGEEPILLFPRAPSETVANSAAPTVAPPPSVAVPTVSIPAAAVPTASIPSAAPQIAALSNAAVPPADAGITVATKGEVSTEARSTQAPAERLGLTGDKRVKAEKCLTQAIYFESGIEPVRGQIAVAQVVMNRVFSGYYPNDVCGVVFQNVHRYLACQFTFACNGKRLIVANQAMWDRAARIAQETLDGKLWLPEVAKATHYHANYVHPWWAHAMYKYAQIGLHIFYRPRMWGDGSDKPIWGSAAYTTEAAAKM